jgi:hypothetical protein
MAVTLGQVRYLKNPVPPVMVSATRLEAYTGP